MTMAQVVKMSVTDNKNPIQDYAEVDLAVVNSASP